MHDEERLLAGVVHVVLGHPEVAQRAPDTGRMLGEHVLERRHIGGRGQRFDRQGGLLARQGGHQGVASYVLGTGPFC